MADSRGDRGELRQRRLIFSRKGFDSGYGGRPSPILPNGVMVSLPIPETDGVLRYSQCVAPCGGSYGSLLTRLGIERIRDPSGRPARWLQVADDPGVHLDPDLWFTALGRGEGWRPLFGQVGASQTHLVRNGVGVGDVFLFFGWFSPVAEHGDRLRYRTRAEQVQAMFGWMEVADVITVATDPIPPWAQQHPHVCNKDSVRFRSHNTLYVAATESSFVPGLAGAGVFRWHPMLRLTQRGATPSVWELPKAFHPEVAHALLTHHGPDSFVLDGEYTSLRSARIGQEFVIPMTSAIREWVSGVLRCGASATESVCS